MNLARIGRGAAALRQGGFALIAILALAAMIAAFLIAIGMNRSSAEISNEREDRSMSALKQAKAALIAYVANEQWQAGGATPFQPGAFPCPDRDNDGIAEDHEFPQKPCNAALKRIGRLPWQTIGADDLRDSSGERLWYAVSAGFLKNTPLYTNIINSDTQGQLTVNGTAASNAVVAVVFAPGQPVQGQVRDPTDPVGYNNPANFLEQFNAATSTYSQYNTATYDTFYSTGLPSRDFNDRLLVITQADVMAAVEPVVAANIERDIASSVQTYFNNYGAYPFPVPFDPTRTPQSAYQGTPTPPLPPLTRGMLPVTRATLQWKSASVSIAHLSAFDTGSPVVNSMDCSASNSSQISCQIDYSQGSDDRPAIQIQATLLKAAVSFPDTIDPTSTLPSPIITMINKFGGQLQTTAFGYWTASGLPQFVPTVSNVALSGGDAVVTITGRLQNGDPIDGTGGRVTITILPPNYLRFTDPNDLTYGWFVANGWYRQTYYAVAEGFLPGGVGACNPPTTTAPSCLSVANLRPSYANSNDKRAILVLAGRSLNGTRPPASSSPAAYFENANLTAATNFATFAFENRPGSPTSINDRVVVVYP